MSRKYKRRFIITIILLVSFTTIAAGRGWVGPLLQTGMGMPTETMMPQLTTSTSSPQIQSTPTPLGVRPQSSVPSLTMTSIFTGFTPDPNVMSTSNPSMSGSGMMGGIGSGGMMMGTGSMTGTVTMSGMGMGGCPMMSGMGMSSTGMTGDETMSGMNMNGDYSTSGLDVSGSTGDVENDSSRVLSDPWLLLGWVLLALVVLVILVGVVFGIIWIVRRPRQTHPI